MYSRFFVPIINRPQPWDIHKGPRENARLMPITQKVFIYNPKSSDANVAAFFI
ncbi:hypothetical protein [Acetobacterium bakii]|uniref:hypothetical protein n=1 Tax=Acetobacterium bakii TaxID=52689 RepID=UPI001364AE16|nr:hypothetical protein [Acetobacterium bakii]